MASERILTTIAGASSDARVEVALRETVKDDPVLELRRLSWGKGIGWYRQQTLQLDPTEAEELLQTLRASRPKWWTKTPHSTGKVIPFPLFMDRHEKYNRQVG